ncbi:hypothetical protein AAFF_G00275770 [Aldrovandia affinis]|uniref:Fibrinogen C-terminal domain-containing protein n=1 Tax=Aldrovandia affinis TaxID=143900 RepID=A0AAD7RB58_9TELE|nr:hypothetical protein AAFF_G00275770 [Aldrovandia affinis]
MRTVTLAMCAAMAMASALTGAFPLERKGGKERVQFAAWDDVNVIAHGLLQLGQGLKEHVDKTKGQVRDLSARLSAFDGTVAELGLQTRRLQRDGEARARARALQGGEEERALNASAELRAQGAQLQGVGDRVSRLEERVEAMMMLPPPRGTGTNGNYSDARVIQWMLEAQNRRIDDLVGRIRQQQDNLETQNVRIRTLQNQIQQRKEWSFLSRKVDEGSQNGSTVQGDSPTEVTSSDCHALFLRGETRSGVYTIQPIGSQPFQVFCEMTSEGGWTVIQRRQDGSVDFDQLWQAVPLYQPLCTVCLYWPLCSLTGEFWLGLEKIRSVSQGRDCVLQVALSDWKDDAQSLRYSFRLDGEEGNYALHLQDSATGGPASSLSTEAGGLPFSTRDRDNDLKADTNCAKLLSGGWWFGNCGRSNLNGRYVPGQPPRQRHERKQGVFWKTWRGRHYPLKTTVMKIAPAKIQHSS